MSEISSGTVLITGPTGGLGRSATMAMANRPEGERPDLLLVGRPGPALHVAGDEARAAGATVHEISCDLASLVDHRRLAVEIGNDEPAEQACVGAAGADDLDGGFGVLGYFGQAVELASHDLGAAGGAVQDAFAEDAPELGRTRSARNCLAGQAGGYLLVEVVQVPAGAGGQDRAGVVLGLEQAGDDERLVPAQHRGLGFDAGPLPGPAVQALLAALLQVIPQAGQRAAGAQLGYRVEAGREVLSRGPLPRLDRADHVVRDGGPGGQVLLGQARPGPVEAQPRAEHARGRPGTAGIVRHLFGILSGRAAPRRQSVGIRADPVSSGSPRATGCETQIRPKGEGQ